MTPQQRDLLTKALAFSLVKGLNRKTAAQLVSCTGGVEMFFEASDSTLQAITKIKSALLSREYRDGLLQTATKEIAFVESNNMQVALSVMPEGLAGTPLVPYPHRLTVCDDAPAVLFMLGRCDIEHLRTIGIVGTRHATPYGTELTARVVADLAEKVGNLVIVSGLAYGIDVAAHRAAIKAGVPTVAVLAHGLNTIYPAEHRSVAATMARNGGMLMTEYPTSAQTHQMNFLARNRIVAGLCDGLLVVESDERGGAMSTARIASAYSREVMAVPGRVSDRYSSGCNRIIANQLATLVRDAGDITNLMRWPVKPQEGAQATLTLDKLTPTQLTVLRHIKANPDDTVNEMCLGLNMPYNTLTDILFTLEMDDHIVQVPGNRYAVITKL